MENLLDNLKPKQLGIGVLRHANPNIKITQNMYGGYEWADINKSEQGVQEVYFTLREVDRNPQIKIIKDYTWTLRFKILAQEYTVLTISMDMVDSTGVSKRVPVDVINVEKNTLSNISTIIPRISDFLSEEDMSKIKFINIVIDTDNMSRYQIRGQSLTQNITHSIGIDEEIVYDGSPITRSKYIWSINKGINVTAATLPFGFEFENTNEIDRDVYLTLSKKYLDTISASNAMLYLNGKFGTKKSVTITPHADYYKENLLVKSFGLEKIVLEPSTDNKINIQYGNISNHVNPDEYDKVVIALSIPAKSTIKMFDFNISKSKGIIGSQSTNSESHLPTLALMGSLPETISSKSIMRFDYMDKGKIIKGFGKIKYQGQSSKDLPKKNLGLKAYSDEACSVEFPFSILPDAKKSKSFSVKAFYSEGMLALDPVANDVLYRMTTTRKIIEEKLSDSLRLGTCYGRPVIVTVNEEYFGLYYMRIGGIKDALNLSDSDTDSFEIESLFENDECMMNKPHIIDWDNNFGLNFPDVLTKNMKTKFDNFVNYVYTSTPQTFKIDDISRDIAIDYIIFYNYFGNIDSCGRNLAWLTRDGGNTFCLMPYDFNQSMLNSWDGKKVADINVDGFPVKQMRFGTKSHKYFDLVAQTYKKELTTRWKELRSTVLREDLVIKMYQEYMNGIGDYEYERDMKKWPRKTVITGEYMNHFIYKRFKIVDKQFKDHLK